jgi:hypothetical protein
MDEIRSVTCYKLVEGSNVTLGNNFCVNVIVYFSLWLGMQTIMFMKGLCLRATAFT